MRRRTLIAGALLWPGLAVGQGVPLWRAVPERSSIRFVYVIDGAEAEGRFRAFRAEGRFDLDRPEAAELDLAIEADSIDLGNRLVNVYATSGEWFDTGAHPLVRYSLSALSSLGAGRYAAEGIAVVKGRAAPVAAELALAIGRDEARATGSLGLSRSEFDLGTELTDLVVDLGDRVTVRFDLVARRAT